MSDEDYEPRPEDFLVEPMFAPFERRDGEAGDAGGRARDGAPDVGAGAPSAGERSCDGPGAGSPGGGLRGILRRLLGLG